MPMLLFRSLVQLNQAVSVFKLDDNPVATTHAAAPERPQHATRTVDITPQTARIAAGETPQRIASPAGGGDWKQF